MRLVTCLALFSGFLAGALAAQDNDKLISGPPQGKFIPGAFECFNVNGAGAGRPRCLVCKFALNPSVLIFVNEKFKAKQEVVDDFIKQLEELTEEFADREFSVGVIYLTPDAKDSANNAKETESSGILEESLKREQAHSRLRMRAFGFDLNQAATITEVQPGGLADAAGFKQKDVITEAKAGERTLLGEDTKFESVKAREDLFRIVGKVPRGQVLYLKVKRNQQEMALELKLKNVILGCYLPEGPAKFNINPKAEFTVLFYDRLTVLQNWTFAPGQLEAKDVNVITDQLRRALPLRKKDNKGAEEKAAKG